MRLSLILYRFFWSESFEARKTGDSLSPVLVWITFDWPSALPAKSPRVPWLSHASNRCFSCPGCCGIRVQFAAESVSSLARNSQRARRHARPRRPWVSADHGSRATELSVEPQCRRSGIHPAPACPARSRTGVAFAAWRPSGCGTMAGGPTALTRPRRTLMNCGNSSTGSWGLGGQQ